MHVRLCRSAAIAQSCLNNVVAVTHAHGDCYKLAAAGMLGYVVLLEHLRKLMYLYHVLTILQTVSIVLLLVQFWRKW